MKRKLQFIWCLGVLLVGMGLVAAEKGAGVIKLGGDKTIFEHPGSFDLSSSEERPVAQPLWKRLISFQKRQWEQERNKKKRNAPHRPEEPKKQETNQLYTRSNAVAADTGRIRVRKALVLRSLSQEGWQFPQKASTTTDEQDFASAALEFARKGGLLVDFFERAIKEDRYP